MISHSFYTQSAFRFGEWYGHMALFPVLDEMKDRTERMKSSYSRETLADWLMEYYAEYGAKYELEVSLITCTVSKHYSHIYRSNLEHHQSIIPLKMGP